MIGVANNAIAQPSVSIAQASSAATPTDSRLPDGTEYVSWEQPLKFSKTYFVDNNAAQADDSGPGTRERPFRTINKAAQVLQPGERVVIASGVYRECVRPLRGGSGPDRDDQLRGRAGGEGFHQRLRDSETGLATESSSDVPPHAQRPGCCCSRGDHVGTRINRGDVP